MQVTGLEDVARALVVDVMDLRADRARAVASRTLLGTCRNFLGYALCAYCIFKCVLLQPAELAGSLSSAGHMCECLSAPTASRAGRGPAQPSAPPVQRI